MSSMKEELKELLDKVPRRHSNDNLKEINGLLSQYEDLLLKIESINSYYEKNTAVLFEDLEKVKSGIKKSADNKASKKNKDDYFSEASSDLKQSIESAIEIYADGNKTV